MHWSWKQGDTVLRYKNTCLIYLSQNKCLCVAEITGFSKLSRRKYLAFPKTKKITLSLYEISMFIRHVANVIHIGKELRDLKAVIYSIFAEAQKCNLGSKQ